MKWSKKAKEIADEEGWTKSSIERDLKLFSATKRGNFKWFIRAEKICVKFV